MNFFTHFPTTPYVFQSNTTFGLTMVNLQTHVKVVERLRQNITVLHDYVIQDGDRPDTVAQRVYGDVNYTWVILLLNNIFTLFDWPLTNEEFDNYIVEKYGSVAAASALLLYKTIDGHLIDYDSWLLLGEDMDVVPVLVYDDELTKNEAKRRIKVVPSTHLSPMMVELKKVLAE